MNTKIPVSIVLFLTLLSCRSINMPEKVNVQKDGREIIFAPGASAIVYKTKKDYRNFVPIIMDAKKEQIVSYPAPTDLHYKGYLAYPTVLKEGYLLDNMGINQNVVFINYTYEKYSLLEKAPPLEEIMGLIIDKDPLSEMIDCGLRSQYKNEEEELNSLIDAGFPNCIKKVETIVPPLLNIK